MQLALELALVLLASITLRDVRETKILHDSAAMPFCFRSAADVEPRESADHVNTENRNHRFHPAAGFYREKRSTLQPIKPAAPRADTVRDR